LRPVTASADYVETSGLLDDDSFYRLVSCGAAPKGACQQPILHWRLDRPVRVQLTRIDRAFLGGKKKRAEAALVRALQHINTSGAAISLAQVAPGAEADVEIYFIDTDGKTPIRGTGVNGLDGATVPGAKVMVWSGGPTGAIRRARIVFGTRLSIRHYESAMLEELVQALGLMTDIKNPLYDGVSVFSQDSNDAKRLGPQDIMALRRHYPPGD
jgi:hypothetical protein